MKRWHYYYRRYLGFIPIQFCMICGKPYWGGLPLFGFASETSWKLTWLWQASWQDCCSRQCNEIDFELAKAMTVDLGKIQ